MPYRKIPRKFDFKEIVADLKATVLYSDEIEDGVVKRIAENMGVSKRTVYATLDGEIKLSLDFLHAAVIATHGHPKIAKYLVPEGYRLERCSSKAVPDKETLAEECLDDLPLIAEYHRVLNDPMSNKPQVQVALSQAKWELEQNINKWVELHNHPEPYNAD
jgi:predicted transcriptional regulator